MPNAVASCPTYPATPPYGLGAGKDRRRVRGRFRAKARAFTSIHLCRLLLAAYAGAQAVCSRGGECGGDVDDGVA
jgi:hypothetical protein